MSSDPILFTIFLIFGGAAVLATAGLYAKQSLLLVYILIGVLFGPSMLGLTGDPQVIKDIAKIGIIFLLFLMGLNLPPRKLFNTARETALITVFSSLLFAVIGASLALTFGYVWTDSLIIGIALMFSSTIIGLKLLPTTVLHHRRRGEMIISILLWQDLIAIFTLLLLQTGPSSDFSVVKLLTPLLALGLLAVFAYLFSRYVLLQLMARFDRIQEYIFLLSIGWCLGLAELAAYLGVSHEIGAFIAGVALAQHPISLYIAETLKPLRDFFLILFFFSLGAGFDLHEAGAIVIPACVIAVVLLASKPLIFHWLLHRVGEHREITMEIGVRLGQASEFALLIALVAADNHLVGSDAAYLIQLSTLLTFVISSFWVVHRYPTPVAVNDKLRRD